MGNHLSKKVKLEILLQNPSYQIIFIITSCDGGLKIIRLLIIDSTLF